MSDENTPEAEALRSSRRAQEAATAASEATKETEVAVERIVQPTLSSDAEVKKEDADQAREEEQREAPQVQVRTEGIGPTFGYTSLDRYYTGSDGIKEGGEGEGRV